ncbi:hypothetical protein GCM10011490_10160 [Pseudoclavibacter endophyticus]|uniref:LuxR family transcriptional regulator n=1 Tax=Pseudoclavibacter endophyticus TaxID=1778590 RepID=A0A6H9WN73_9MICO|nr:cupin domain-containing protein [Pseudoclavibacter endophyticus]KAB1649538.1 LuxR family transcriptional regulator [Pseudoclavibacter endophyticus]GGA61801.1 hypothetical protein GCM10011490_10160 [Pseudoclavibacter endophyticus]
MTHDSNDLLPTNLITRHDKLLAAARTANAHRAAETVYGSRDTLLRQTVLALLAGSHLAEHESPPEATLHVLTGRVRLNGQARSWELNRGDLIAIPPERHSVTAIEDSVFLLTVVRAASDASASTLK